MTYFEAVKVVLFYNYFDFVETDSVSGNGLTIFLYGLKLILIYFLLFVVRVMSVLIFPLFAIVVMRFNSRVAKKYKDWLNKNKL